ncbi:MAG: hypothetical protein K2Q10_01345, partial [Rhodospirillales bacterium]|nr:hypothetical protein [Rhodospirillales bacterium]
MAGVPLFPSARRHGTTAKAVILAMAGLVTLSVCGTIGVSAYEDYRRTLTVAETRTRDAVRVLEEHARRTFETSDRVLRRVIDHLHADGLGAFTSPGHYPELKALAATLPETGSLWIQDDAGRLISSSRIENTSGLVFGDREYWQVHAQGADTHIGPLIISRISQSMYFTYSRAMRDDQGKLLAVAVAAIVPSYVSEYFSWAGDGNELAFGLYKDNGDIVL